MRGRIVFPPVLNKLKELLGASLLKDAHERGSKGLHLRGRDFGNLAIAVDKRAANLLELEIARHVRVGQEADDLTVGHHELGDQVNVVISVFAELFGDLDSLAEFAMKLVDVVKVEGWFERM